jgi:hypothetical protein
MSITFFAANASGRPLLRCSCDLDGPVEFMTCPACQAEINLCNTNALDLLAWIGLAPASYGEAPAHDVAARCRRRLWDEARNHDPAVPAVVLPAGRGARLIAVDRQAGYLRQRAADLLAVAERAGEGLVCWA